MTMRTMPLDLYERLKLPHHSVTQDEISKAYRALRLEIDPLGLDVNHDRLAEIGQAYDVLGDPKSRKEYDDYLKGKSGIGASMSDGTFKRRRPPPATDPQAPSPPGASSTGSPTQSAPSQVPASMVKPRIWSLAAYTMWRIDTMDRSTKVATTLLALIVVPALIVTVVIGTLLAEVASIALLVGLTYLVVQCWSSMPIARRIALVAGCGFVTTAAAVVLITWPLTLHIIVGLGIAVVVVVAIRIALYFA